MAEMLTSWYLHSYKTSIKTVGATCCCGVIMSRMLSNQQSDSASCLPNSGSSFMLCWCNQVTSHFLSSHWKWVSLQSLWRFFEERWHDLDSGFHSEASQSCCHNLRDAEVTSPHPTNTLMYMYNTYGINLCLRHSSDHGKGNVQLYNPWNWS